LEGGRESHRGCPRAGLARGLGLGEARGRGSFLRTKSSVTVALQKHRRARSPRAPAAVEPLEPLEALGAIELLSTCAARCAAASAAARRTSASAASAAKRALSACQAMAPMESRGVSGAKRKEPSVRNQA
jgi:hypothetical protein